MRAVSYGMTIGFIGQGFVGKNYADDFERRGFSVVRYALDEPYVKNRDAISSCAWIFIAVPTPTTQKGFDDSILRAVLPLVGKGNTAVIKSTTLPGTVKKLQAAFPDILILHSPEFLTEKNAAHDAGHPSRNIIGVPQAEPTHRRKAEELMGLLPKAPYELIADSTETELIKYAGNAFLYFKVVFANLFHDLAAAQGADFERVREALAADPRIGPSHLGVLDRSGHSGAALGRGAGGHCLIKDFAALRMLYESVGADEAGAAVLRALERKNIELLTRSGKDPDLLKSVYRR